MKRIILLIIFLLFTQTIFADSTFDDLKKTNEKTLQLIPIEKLKKHAIDLS